MPFSCAQHVLNVNLKSLLDFSHFTPDCSNLCKVQIFLPVDQNCRKIELSVVLVIIITIYSEWTHLCLLVTLVQQTI